ncbi:MAG: hypothetical protein AAGH60_15515 [Pseudomonadota bacterium]
MSTKSTKPKKGGSTLGGLIVLLINVVGFGGIGYAVGGVTGAIWVTLVGLALFALLFAWPTITTGAEQTGIGKLVVAPIALIASFALFIPAMLVSLLRKAAAKRDERLGIEPSADPAPVDEGPKKSFFRGRWTDATTLSMFLVNAVIALIIAVIVFGPMAATFFAVFATPIFITALFFIGLNGANPTLAQPGEDEDIVEA